MRGTTPIIPHIEHSALMSHEGKREGSTLKVSPGGDQNGAGVSSQGKASPTFPQQAPAVQTVCSGHMSSVNQFCFTDFHHVCPDLGWKIGHWEIAMDNLA